MIAAILILTGLLALGGLVVIGALVKMIRSGDYSSLVGNSRDRDRHQASHPQPALVAPASLAITKSEKIPLQLWPLESFQPAVAHFLPDLTDPRQRRKVAEGLREIIEIDQTP